MSCGWIFGRGASIAHGVRWTVPSQWYSDYESGACDRENVIKDITDEMRRLSDATDPVHYKLMINILLTNSAPEQLHYLTTTNWDYLAQRAFDQERESGRSIPYNTLRDPIHINGSAEPGEWTNRSQFVLEVDEKVERRRIWSHEGQLGFDALTICQTIVVVGLSFECADDRGFLSALADARTNGTYDGAFFVLVDPSTDVLMRNHEFLLRAFRKVTVEEIPMGFDAWVASGLKTTKVPIFVLP